MTVIIPIACPICGDGSDRALAAMAEYADLVPDAAVCSSCAERIANAFSKKHSSEWLTWPNSAEPAPSTKKAVIGQALRTQVFERDMYRCLRCHTHISLRVDHILPESKGGPATIDNLQTLCQSCNSWKGVRTIDFRGQAQ